MEQGYSLLDIHLAGFLAARSRLAGEKQQVFRRLVCELSRALADGHSCLPVTPDEAELLAGSPLVSTADRTPLILFNECLYLHRYSSYEMRLAQGIAGLARQGSEVSQDLIDQCFGPARDEDQGQRLAARLAAQRHLAIISGGPGTGKTTTVVKIIGILLRAFGSDLRVALAAPTGKAAMRLGLSVGRSRQDLPLADEVKEAIPDQALTLHRLLGVQGSSTRCKYNKDNPLPWDVVVVDEASMVDLALMCKLLDALNPEARLILLGDKDQLVSVESGAVLADCIEALPENTVELQKTYRFNADIALFSRAINTGDANTARTVLVDPAASATRLLTEPVGAYAGRRYLDYMRLVSSVEEVGMERIFAVFNGFRILCALRNGPAGVQGINAMLERILTGKGYDCLSRTWYPGRPVLVTRNDYSLGLYNGDIGITLPHGADGSLRVVFQGPDGSLRSFLPFRLASCETAYAMTIHKCQGSEFDDVLVVLPEKDNQILCRELVYTAVTRARKQVLLSADEEIFRLALARKIRRYSNLKDRLSAV